MKIKVQKLHPDAKLPVYSTAGSSAFDLFALTVHGAYQLGANTDHGRPLLCGTGLAFDIPAGHGMLIMSRSGMGFKNGVRLSNCIGLIDADYRGEVMVQLTQDYLHGQDDFEFIPPFICPGDRIAQAIIIPMPRVEFELCDELPATTRGVAGFGSTGGIGGESNEQAGKLWAIHIPGPDELYAAPDYETAQKMAEKHNAAIEQYLDKNKMDWAKTMIAAAVIEWPGDDDGSHSKALLKFDPQEWGFESKPS